MKTQDSTMGTTSSEDVKLQDDIADLARMASIVEGLIEDSLCRHRAVRVDDSGVYTFNFSDTWLDDVQFAVSNVARRAASVEAHAVAIFNKE